MALSVHKSFAGPAWPLGFVTVTAAGTPVPLMTNVDANNYNAPETAIGPFTVAQGLGTAPTCHKIIIQPYKPGANNNGMVSNTGNIYLMVAPAGGAGNRSDSGAMCLVIPPGSGSGTWPAQEMEGDTISPYKFFLDADVSGEGGLVTLTI